MTAAWLHYVLDGPNDGPVLVLGPSLGTTLDLWAGHVPGLTAAGWRVLRYDLRGHGGSEVIPGAPEVADLAADVVALLDRLGVDRCVAGGVSLGGAVAASLAIERPELVRGLVLCCTSARFGEARPWQERAARVRAEGMDWLADTAAARWFAPGFPERRPDVALPLLDGLRQVNPDGYAACCVALGWYDLRPRLSEITAPTLVIAGADDPVTPPAHAEELVAGIPAASMRVIPGASHLAVVEQPEEVGRAMLDHLKGLQ